MYVLFYDSLNAHVSPLFQDAVRQSKGIVWYGVPNVTHRWQPIDAGYGRLIQREQDERIQFDGNLELWLGNSAETAKKRIIL